MNIENKQNIEKDFSNDPEELIRDLESRLEKNYWLKEWQLNQLVWIYAEMEKKKRKMKTEERLKELRSGIKDTIWDLEISEKELEEITRLLQEINDAKNDINKLRDEILSVGSFSEAPRESLEILEIYNTTLQKINIYLEKCKNNPKDLIDNTVWFSIGWYDSIKTCAIFTWEVAIWLIMALRDLYLIISGKWKYDRWGDL